MKRFKGLVKFVKEVTATEYVSDSDDEKDSEVSYPVSRKNDSLS